MNRTVPPGYNAIVDMACKAGHGTAQEEQKQGPPRPPPPPQRQQPPAADVTPSTPAARSTQAATRAATRAAEPPDPPLAEEMSEHVSKDQTGDTPGPPMRPALLTDSSESDADDTDSESSGMIPHAFLLAFVTVGDDEYVVNLSSKLPARDDLRRARQSAKRTIRMVNRRIATAQCRYPLRSRISPPALTTDQAEVIATLEDEEGLDLAPPLPDVETHVDESKWEENRYIPQHRFNPNPSLRTASTDQPTRHNNPNQPLKVGMFAITKAWPDEPQYDERLPIWISRIDRYVRTPHHTLTRTDTSIRHQDCFVLLLGSPRLMSISTTAKLTMWMAGRIPLRLNFWLVVRKPVQLCTIPRALPLTRTCC